MDKLLQKLQKQPKKQERPLGMFKGKIHEAEIRVGVTLWGRETTSWPVGQEWYCYEGSTTFDSMVVVVKKRTPRAKLKTLLKEGPRKRMKGFDAKRFNGALTLAGDPITVQRKLRDEW